MAETYNKMDVWGEERRDGSEGRDGRAYVRLSIVEVSVILVRHPFWNVVSPSASRQLGGSQLGLQLLIIEHDETTFFRSMSS